MTILSGIGEALTTRTVDGFYAFYGVAGDVRLRATRDGYVDKIEQITVTGHRSHSFEMTPSRPRIDLSGTYTLTVTTEDTGSILSGVLLFGAAAGGKTTRICRNSRTDSRRSEGFSQWGGFRSRPARRRKHLSWHSRRERRDHLLAAASKHLGLRRTRRRRALERRHGDLRRGDHQCQEHVNRHFWHRRQLIWRNHLPL